MATDAISRTMNGNHGDEGDATDFFSIGAES
jgi:hypothetical protein